MSNGDGPPPMFDGDDFPYWKIRMESYLKAERMLLTLNNVVRTLLIHAAMPPPYLAEALSTAMFLTNRWPSSSKNNGIPYHLLHHKMPDYSILRVFGCLCYPNLSAMTHHKLSPHSTTCVFLDYLSSQKGYRCLDVSNRKIIISCHIVFDETHFLFVASKPRPDSLDFFIQHILSVPAPSTLAGHTLLLKVAGDPVWCRLQAAPGGAPACSSWYLGCSCHGCCATPAWW